MVVDPHVEIEENKPQLDFLVLSDATVYRAVLGEVLKLYSGECTKTMLPQCANYTYLSLGLASEAGEVAGKVKKLLRGDIGGSLDTKGIGQELADCLWYIFTLCHVLKIDPATIMLDNLTKLSLRKMNGTIQGNGDDR